MVIEYYDNDYNYNHDNFEREKCNISGQVCAGPCVDVEGEMVCPFVKWQWDEVFVILMIINSQTYFFLISNVSRILCV